MEHPNEARPSAGDDAALRARLSLHGVEVVFSRTEGDSTHRPPNLDPTPDTEGQVNYYHPVSHNDPTTLVWLNKVGAEMAKRMGVPSASEVKYRLRSFPAKYQLYYHRKGPKQNPRHDVYLYGCPGKRFRSPSEFFDHAWWLLTDESLNPENCGCKYDKGTGWAKIRGTKNIGGTRHNARQGRPGNVLSEHHANVRPAQPVYRVGTAAPFQKKERDREIRRDGIGYRKAELVWVRLDEPVVSENGANKEGDDDDDDRWPLIGEGGRITHWPAIIQDTVLLCDPAPSPSARTTSSTPTPRTIQRTCYTCLLLGTRDNIERFDDQIRPWLSMSVSISLLQEFHARLPSLKDKVFLKCPRTSYFSIFNKPKEATSNQISRSPLKSFQDCLLPFILGVQYATEVSRVYTFFGEFNIPGKHFSSPLPADATDAEKAESEKANEAPHYQGVWWGAEKIWVGEVVRLRISEDRVPQLRRLLKRFSKPLSSKARDDADAMEISDDEDNELNEDNTLHRASFVLDVNAMYRVNGTAKLAGDLYEVVEGAQEGGSQPGTSGAGSASTSSHSAFRSRYGGGLYTSRDSSVALIPPTLLLSGPGAPKGTHLQLMSHPEHEFIVDINDLAGRYYPKLSSRFDLGLSKQMKAAADLPDYEWTEKDSAKAFKLGCLGYLSGSERFMPCEKHVPSRYDAVKDSETTCLKVVVAALHGGDEDDNLDDNMGVDAPSDALIPNGRKSNSGADVGNAGDGIMAAETSGASKTDVTVFPLAKRGHGAGGRSSLSEATKSVPSDVRRTPSSDRPRSSGDAAMAIPHPPVQRPPQEPQEEKRTSSFPSSDAAMARPHPPMQPPSPLPLPPQQQQQRRISSSSSAAAMALPHPPVQPARKEPQEEKRTSSFPSNGAAMDRPHPPMQLPPQQKQQQQQQQQQQRSGAAMGHPPVQPPRKEPQEGKPTSSSSSSGAAMALPHRPVQPPPQKPQKEKRTSSSSSSGAAMALPHRPVQPLPQKPQKEKRRSSSSSSSAPMSLSPPVQPPPRKPQEKKRRSSSSSSSAPMSLSPPVQPPPQKPQEEQRTSSFPSSDAAMGRPDPPMPFPLPPPLPPDVQRHVRRSSSSSSRSEIVRPHSPMQQQKLKRKGSDLAVALSPVYLSNAGQSRSRPPHGQDHAGGPATASNKARHSSSAEKRRRVD